MSKKGEERAFGNSLYTRNAPGYDEFVSRCNYENILNELPRLFSGKNLNALELGAGTGIFTLPLSAECSSVTAIERSRSQIDILSKRLADNGVGNVSIICGDANAPSGLIERSFDLIFMGFSLDNICEVDVYKPPDIGALAKLFETYDRLLSPSGRYVLIDSMPEDTIAEGRKKRYRACRERQFAFFAGRQNCELVFLDYQVEFEDVATAIAVMTAIAGRQRAKAIVRQKPDIALRAYLATFQIGGRD